jgi:DNA (cytosine-5)-methyltransferase 1
MARIVGEVQPRFAFIENSPMLRTRGLSTVLKDLAEIGYDARWGVFGACDVGAPHKRERMWILAYTKSRGLQVGMPAQTTQYNAKCRDIPQEWDISKWKQTGETPTIKPLLGRDADGVAYRVDRIKRIGNGQVPAVVRLAWETLISGI